ncbi:hypothetical protein [Leifsonia xyli]|uniref:hypothetical protein n=1 Tax=Leifsonia xyli TaxID=1575 RepID=UPI0002FB4D28|nr:hypothetical protein [Leifsonia xyli]
MTVTLTFDAAAPFVVTWTVTFWSRPQADAVWAELPNASACRVDEATAGRAVEATMAGVAQAAALTIPRRPTLTDETLSRIFSFN